MLLQEFRLDGRVALVAGGGRGLGRTIALALAEAGADIAVAARTPHEIQETAEQVRALGRRAVALRTDVRVAREVQEMADRTVAELGRIDILVNSAGLGLEKSFMEITEEEWRQVIDTNLLGTFLCCQAVGKHLLAQGQGKVINLTSGLALRGIEKGAAYCASKGGVLQLTRALSLEWAP
ncbi:MAG: SDR family NAD(P)-dependent oxidoreductase, partial [Candidatus Tectomicrobia bacterium]|nr:SDR family NAD(P)-dependent oxidoreductase [Candidatus Tectomicrobia bacterium]